MLLLCLGGKSGSDLLIEVKKWSEKSSTGTLLSASITSNSPEPHLPSYLSLACTVNGYSTITNYDPVRLSKSRDASPHRPNSEHLTQNYTLNNLLSPPNLVPLPTHAKQTSENMTDQQFYTTSNRIESYCMKETRFSNNFISKDSVDACFVSNHEKAHDTFISSFENEVKNVSQKHTYSSTVTSELCKNQETKSFIQQRVERLYGPGALAQGFFVMKRQKSRLSESVSERKVNGSSIHDNHSKSMSDKLLYDSEESHSMKQSASSPVLPVLRHLRPEFRAQLPIISPRRSTESSIQKSITVPILKEELNVNGLSKDNGNTSGIQIQIEPVPEELEVKDGHYFLKILDNETNRLLKLADECENLLTIVPDLPEDAIGKIRSTFGKARLLVSQKMQQFKGLCTNNITQIEGEAFPTTNEDLQGFWDMVMLQVNQVDDLFHQIEKLKANNWKEIEQEKLTKTTMNGNKSKRVVNRSTKNTANNVEAQKQREAREMERKRLIEERRKAMKAKNSQQNIEIFVPESS
ncbi:hypothetical protein WA026_021730 [Henosepilachna vigintioctopunctata]|uniref:Disks large-associated protein 1 n=1 Tax=Henosepilachna vigintioctopunctata TaxID=420089 RepID=A0AAW1TZU2_9CUCU